MRIETKIEYQRLYKFNELSEKVKEKIMNDYINDDNQISVWYDCLQEEFYYRFTELFPKDTAKIYRMHFFNLKNGLKICLQIF